MSGHKRTAGALVRSGMREGSKWKARAAHMVQPRLSRGRRLPEGDPAGIIRHGAARLGTESPTRRGRSTGHAGLPLNNAGSRPWGLSLYLYIGPSASHAR